MFGFSKNEMENIGSDDLQIFRQAAQVTLGFDDAILSKLLAAGELIEVKCNEEKL